MLHTAKPMPTSLVGRLSHAHREAKGDKLGMNLVLPRRLTRCPGVLRAEPPPCARRWPRLVPSCKAIGAEKRADRREQTSRLGQEEAGGCRAFGQNIGAALADDDGGIWNGGLGTGRTPDGQPPNKWLPLPFKSGHLWGRWRRINTWDGFRGSGSLRQLGRQGSGATRCRPISAPSTLPDGSSAMKQHHGFFHVSSTWSSSVVSMICDRNLDRRLCDVGSASFFGSRTRCRILRRPLLLEACGRGFGSGRMSLVSFGKLDRRSSSVRPLVSQFSALHTVPRMNVRRPVQCFHWTAITPGCFGCLRMLHGLVLNLLLALDGMRCTKAFWTEDDRYWK